MKRITLDKIRRSLETMTHEVVVPAEVAARARRSVERMLALSPLPSPVTRAPVAAVPARS
jgi:quinolinate synthase